MNELQYKEVELNDDDYEEIMKYWEYSYHKWHANVNWSEEDAEKM